MPTRPRKPCAYPNCPELVEAGETYCFKHKGLYDKSRGSPAKRGYDTKWQKIRMMVLKEEPLCRRCKAKGLIVLADMVHHIDENPRNNRRENLEPLCWECHRKHHGFGGQGPGV